VLFIGAALAYAVRYACEQKGTSIMLINGVTFSNDMVTSNSKNQRLVFISINIHLIGCQFN